MNEIARRVDPHAALEAAFGHVVVGDQVPEPAGDLQRPRDLKAGQPGAVGVEHIASFICAMQAISR